MKIIISHDIDHLTAWEHKNLFLPKFLLRSTIELLSRTISFREYFLRYQNIFIKNKLQNLEELMKYNKEQKIPATFFIGVNNGMGLDYSLDDALFWAKKINKNGFDVGVHGISFKNFNSIKKEYDILSNFLKNKDIGIRMHYLRNKKETFMYLSKVGYKFDSTILKDSNPYKINNMWEFPLHIMETHIFYQNGKRYTSLKLDEYKKITIKRIKDLENKKINYMTLLFHDIYFNDSFMIWKDWYIWVIEFLKKNYQFISYNDAIKELNEKNNMDN